MLNTTVDGKAVTIVGYFPYITPGVTVDASGRYTSHPVYGEQFSASSYTVVPPEGVAAIERYLAGGAVKGIGPALAKRIVKRFKEDTFRIIDEEPERLAEVSGIGIAAAMRIYEQAQQRRNTREALMFMQKYGISTNIAQRIFDRYGAALYNIIQTNPYRLADEVEGVGFKTADSIALKMGLPKDSEFRMRSGVIYVLGMAGVDGHTWVPRAELVRMCRELLDVEPKDIESLLVSLQLEGRIVIIDKSAQGDECQEQIYLAAYYYTEREIAERLRALAIKGEYDEAQADRRIKSIEKASDITLDDRQREAVKSSVGNGVLIITGGPGTGKTTTINSLIRYYKEDHDVIALAAPTGRAAKRMAEATGCEAKTIHRLLEYIGTRKDDEDTGSSARYEGNFAPLGAADIPGGDGETYSVSSSSERGHFQRDEHNPLEANVVIIDETSMVDIFLMNALLKAIVPGTRLIFAGDHNQLPSVGAGNVLRDMIESGAFATVKLEHVFRQAAQSDIVSNAHRINDGEPVDLSKKSKDFLFIGCARPEAILSAIRKLLMKKLPPYVGCSSFDIQVLTATKKGMLGVENINKVLQQCLNPPSSHKTERRSGDNILREGDKVMQMKNDYDIEWTIFDDYSMTTEQGSGVFNGDIGRIVDIDIHRDIVKIEFDGMRMAEYDRKHINNIELAYAVTVHKSQGSEYPAVVMPMFNGPHMLMNRNLLYTAVTRAKKCVCMVGLPRVFEEMERNEDEKKRLSGLRDRIIEGRDIS